MILSGRGFYPARDSPQLAKTGDGVVESRVLLRDQLRTYTRHDTKTQGIDQANVLESQHVEAVRRPVQVHALNRDYLDGLTRHRKIPVDVANRKYFVTVGLEHLHNPGVL